MKKEPESYVTIHQVENGFILEYEKCSMEDGSGIPITLVYQRKEVFLEQDSTAENSSTAEALCEALRDVVEILGAYGSRYDEKRISISLEPGDKYEAPVDKTKGCCGKCSK